MQGFTKWQAMAFQKNSHETKTFFSFKDHRKTTRVETVIAKRKRCNLITDMCSFNVKNIEFAERAQK